MKNTVLILGASGKFGSHSARAFKSAGWNVRLFKRGEQSMKQAAKGADVIVNGLNPPNYKNWQTAIPKIISQVISAAKSSGATILQPGNVYNFGSSGGVWDENTAQITNTKKGQVRIDMETQLRQATETSDVRVILLRAGDFIDETASGNWFDIALAAKIEKGVFTYPGKVDIDHAWAYLPDLARAAVLLTEKRAELNAFEDVPFGGHTLTGLEICAAFEQQTGRSLKKKGFPWAVMRLASPFWPLARELFEMRYLWDTAHSLDNLRLSSLLPEFQVTPTEGMLRSGISWKLADMPIDGTLAAQS